MTNPEAPKSLIPSPEATAAAALRKMPRPLSEVLLTALSLSAWVTLPVNFISQVSQAPVVIKAYRDALAALRDYDILLAALVEAAAPVVYAWRQLVQPVTDWMLRLAPWMPPAAAELMLVLLMILSPMIQRGRAVARANAGFKQLAAALARGHLFMGPWREILQPRGQLPELDQQALLSQLPKASFIKVRELLLSEFKVRSRQSHPMSNLLTPVEIIIHARYIMTVSGRLIILAIVLSIIMVTLNRWPI